MTDDSETIALRATVIGGRPPARISVSDPQQFFVPQVEQAF
jgi:hypothetical protein